MNIEKIDSLQVGDISSQLQLIDRLEIEGKIRPGFKSIDDLRREVVRKESFVIADQSQRKETLTKESTVISAKIIHGEKKLIKFEQVSHTNGLHQKRNRYNYLREKLISGENPIDALNRNLREKLIGFENGVEIRISEPFDSLFTGRQITFIKSNSHPQYNWYGVNTHFNIFKFCVRFTDSQYIPNTIHPNDQYIKDSPFSYCEVEEGIKSDYFRWVDK